MGKFELWSGPSNVKSYPEESGQSYLAGDLVIFDGGTVKIATDGTDVMGVAIDKASATADTERKVHVITPEQIWSVESTGTPDATMIGDAYDVANFTAGLMVVNVGTGGTDVVLWDLDPRDVPASGSRVLVKFVPGSCDMWGG